MKTTLVHAKGRLFKLVFGMKHISSEIKYPESLADTVFYVAAPNKRVAEQYCRALLPKIPKRFKTSWQLLEDDPVPAAEKFSFIQERIHIVIPAAI